MKVKDGNEVRRAPECISSDSLSSSGRSSDSQSSSGAGGGVGIQHEQEQTTVTAAAEPQINQVDPILEMDEPLSMDSMMGEYGPGLGTVVENGHHDSERASFQETFPEETSGLNNSSASRRLLNGAGNQTGAGQAPVPLNNVAVDTSHDIGEAYEGDRRRAELSRALMMVYELELATEAWRYYANQVSAAVRHLLPVFPSEAHGTLPARNGQRITRIDRFYYILHGDFFQTHTPATALSSERSVSGPSHVNAFPVTPASSSRLEGSASSTVSMVSRSRLPQIPQIQTWRLPSLPEHQLHETNGNAYSLTSFNVPQNQPQTPYPSSAVSAAPANPLSHNQHPGNPRFIVSRPHLLTRNQRLPGYRRTSSYFRYLQRHGSTETEISDLLWYVLSCRPTSGYESDFEDSDYDPRPRL